MANEVRGILYETIAEVALQKAISINGIKGSLYWNEKPSNMTVKPDFTIGPDKDNPTHVILVTASGSSHDSDKKSWRNLGELQEVKAQLSDSPIVINIYFMSELKANLSVVAQKLYDGIVHVDDKPYFHEFRTWVNSNLSNVVKTRDARKEMLASDLEHNNDLAEAVKQLAIELSKILKNRNQDLSTLWGFMQEDYMLPRQVPVARNTSVRRGLAKLMVLEPDLRQKVYASCFEGNSIDGSIPDYVYELGFLGKAVGGARLIDPEIVQVIKLLGNERCERVISMAPPAMDTWIKSLRNLNAVENYVNFIEQNYDKVTNSDKLRDLLFSCFEDPAALSGLAVSEKVWLFEIMVSLIKAKSGRLQGYGLSQISIDTGIPETGKGEKLLRFVLPKFVQRKEMPEEKHLQALADGLSTRFKKDIALEDLTLLKTKVKHWVIKENLEDRLISYRLFEPLLSLLYYELESNKIDYEPKNTYSGWIGEYANIGIKSSTTQFVKVANTLIHWKSVSDAGKVHKKKELSARVRNIKFQYHTESKKFLKRQDVNQLVLIIDGSFDTNDLAVLSEAGWDLIIYSDEIHQLFAQIR